MIITSTENTKWLKTFGQMGMLVWLPVWLSCNTFAATWLTLVDH